MIAMPFAVCYGRHRNNYGSHMMKVVMHDRTLWFSYETLVAFQVRTDVDSHLFIRENIWGPTTGKHLNAICGKKEIRLSEEEFNKQWNKYL